MSPPLSTHRRLWRLAGSSLATVFAGGWVEYLGFPLFLVAAMLFTRLLRGSGDAAAWLSSCIGAAGVTYTAITIATGFAAGAAALYDGHHGAPLATVTVVNDVRIFAFYLVAWGTRSPAPGIAANTFSVRWTGQVLATADGTWTFYTRSDDGVRLWIDGKPVIDHWTTHALEQDRGTIPLTADRAHTVQLEYADRTGSATITLLWSGPGTAKQVVPATRLLAS